MFSICIFGDSATWGAWDKEMGGWANRLRLFIDNNNFNDGFVYNLGVSGDTTEQLLKRLDKEMEAREPNIIIFSIGENDSIDLENAGNNLVPLEKFEANLNKLIDKAKKTTNRILFLGLAPIDEKKTTPVLWDDEAFYKTANIENYDKKLMEAADKNKVEYIRVFGALEKKDLSDGLHPNESGHEKIFLKVKNFLLESKWV